MSEAHAHAPSSAGKLRTAFLLSFLILAVELGGGLVAHSLALISDAGHVLTDLVALGLAWFATIQAQRPADASKTYGYHRTGILAAMLNAITLILIVGFIAFEAISRLRAPSEVTPTLMFASAGIGIIVNLYVGLGLRDSSGENLNVRAAMLHVFGDVAASIGVVVAGLAILLTGWYAADAIVSLLIAVLIAKSAWEVLHETLHILMESTPKHVNVAQLVRDLVRFPNVVDVHDLHVWSIAGGVNAMSAHLQIEGDANLSSCDVLLRDMNSLLDSRYAIRHSTIQLECANCDPTNSDLYCSMSMGEKHEHERGEDGVEAVRSVVIS